jgi:DNA-binding transcriptional LysR family regulator
VPDSLESAALATGSILADATLPWREWLLDQGFGILTDRVVEADSRQALIGAATAGEALIICHRLLAYHKLAEKKLMEVPWLKRSSVTAKLYMSRSYSTTFGEDSRRLFLKVKTAAIRADVEHFDW